MPSTTVAIALPLSTCAYGRVTREERLRLIADRLRASRRETKKTQEEVAREIDVSTMTISRYERGQHLLDLDIATRLADLYGVSVDFLMGRDVEAGVDQESTLERDDDVKTALAELVAAWSSIAIGRPEIGAPPSGDEMQWLQTYSFREDRRMGISVDAQVLLERLLTRRRQHRSTTTPHVVAVLPRPGRIRVEERDKSGKKKS